MQLATQQVFGVLINGLFTISVLAEVPCQVAELVPSAGTPLGSGVGIDEYVVLGAPSFAQEGAAYVFVRSGNDWIERAQLMGSQTRMKHVFGSAVAVQDDVVVIGAPYFDPAGSDFGQAYVFRRDDSGTAQDPTDDTWSEEAMLIPSGSAEDDHFGTSLSISSNRIAIGASGDSIGFGASYVFGRSGNSWVEEAALIGDQTGGPDRFGNSVALVDPLLIVGANGETLVADRSGAAYVFRRNGSSWAQEFKLAPPDGVDTGTFGSAVAICDGYLLVGAPGDDDAGMGAGAVYVYGFDGVDWVQENKFIANDTTFGSHFGRRIACASGQVIIASDISEGTYFFTQNGSLFHQIRKVEPASKIAITSSYAAVGNLVYLLTPTPPCIPASSTWCLLVFVLVVAVMGSLRTRIARDSLFSPG